MIIINDRNKNSESEDKKMQEMRNNKKPIIYYWIIAGIIIILLNVLFFPSILNKQVKEIDYGSFMKMTEEHDIGYVEIGDEQIIFTD